MAVVTGGSRGIGAASARLLAARGWDVCLSFAAEADAAASVVAACEDAGAKACAVRADVARAAEVEALFATIPARLKFLRSPSAETARVRQVLDHMALAYPHVRFTMKTENRTLLSTPGNGYLRDVVAAVHGAELASAGKEGERVPRVLIGGQVLVHADLVVIRLASVNAAAWPAEPDPGCGGHAGCSWPSRIVMARRVTVARVSGTLSVRSSARAWDVPGLRSAFGVAGTGVEPGPGTYDDWPHRVRWRDGSEAGYGPEGGTGPNQLAYLRVPGQRCLYNVWSALGRSHLEALLERLRFVVGAGR